MRRAAPLTILALVLVCAPLAAAKPVVLSPQWRLVVGSKYESAVAGGRYLAMFRAAPASNGLLTLIDEQTGKRRTLSIPPCSGGWYAQPTFGGGWLMAGCSLYNLDSGQWTPFQVSPQCTGCTPGAIGRYWVKIGRSDYKQAPVVYLQNIATGQLVNDPATPGGTVYDDLNAASGSTPLCSPLRYPTSDFGEGPELGGLSFYGSGPRRFALTYSYGPNNGGLTRLRRCGSNLDLPATVVSSRASILQSGLLTLHGWLLPGLQQFMIRSTLPPGQTNPITPVAVTAGRIYVSAEGGRLYSAPLPTARQISSCARYQQERRRRPRVNPCRYS